MSGRRREKRRPVRIHGEPVGDEQINEIRRLTRQQAGATRQAITKKLCQLWDWRLPSGALNLRSCRDLLCRLQEQGLIKLPLRRSRPGARRKVTVDVAVESLHDGAQNLAGDDVDLRRLLVRPVLRSEIPRWRALMARFHYLGDGELVGESLRYVAESESRWVALLSWSAAALKSRHREKFIGWDERCCKRSRRRR